MVKINAVFGKGCHTSNWSHLRAARGAWLSPLLGPSELHLCIYLLPAQVKWGTNQSQELKRTIRSRDVQNESVGLKKEYVRKNVEVLSSECAEGIARIRGQESSICLTNKLVWETPKRFIPSLGWESKGEGGEVPASSRKMFYILRLYNPNSCLMQIARLDLPAAHLQMKCEFLIGPWQTEALSRQPFTNNRVGRQNLYTDLLGQFSPNSSRLRTRVTWVQRFMWFSMIQSSLVKQ